MNFEDIISENQEAVDIKNPVNEITNSVTDMLAPFIWLSVAMTVVFVVLYALSMFRRRKLENALFDIQKNLSELNERDRARSQPVLSPRPSDGRDRIIAQSTDTSEHN